MIPAVSFAAKSTEDKRDSIGTQQEDCRNLAEREGWKLIGEFEDERYSASSRNRGPGLEQAKRVAVAAAKEHGKCILVAQDSDRFARGAGDAQEAADHVAEVFFAMRRQGVELWTVRTGKLDPIRAAIEGERSNDESERKKQSVSGALRKRKAAGKTVGALPLGYVAKYLQPEDEDKTRVVDEEEAGRVLRLFELLAQGHTPGEVARILNKAGIRTKRDKIWTPRPVRDLARVEAYRGRRGYPRIVPDELWQTVQAGLDRRSRPHQRRGLGGQNSEAASAYLLRGLCRCAKCGATLYIRKVAAGRTYVCGNRRASTGLCDAAPIRADVLESAVLARLRKFTGDVEKWITEHLEAQQQQRERQRIAADRERAHLVQVEQRIEHARDRYDRALDEGDDDRAAVVEDELARLRSDRAQRLRAVADADALVAEYTGELDPDAVRKWIEEVVAQVAGRVARAEGAEAVRAAIRAAVSQIIVDTQATDRQGYPGRELLVDVRLRAPEVDNPNVLIHTSPDEPWFLEDMLAQPGGLTLV
jgi:site-specific DNA recombinase